MAFIDEVKIKAQAGRGGDGVVRWRQEKFIPKGGPAGGDGGKGGDIFVKAVRSMRTLAKYKAKTEFKAENGFPGESRSKHGRDGKDIVIELPLGSVIKNLNTNEKFALVDDKEIHLILKGGRGGLGNEQFKSSVNTTPKKSTPGKPGESAEFYIELELFADIGLIGLPNAGKSSLLNSLTNAVAKVGDYAFTTLDPNLGDLHGFTIADIPGLIEGASEGKGLGTRFLKHIKRTKMLVHLVSFENGMNMMKAYKQIRSELEQYGNGLSDKDEVILLTKTDVCEDKKEIDKKIKEFEKLKKPVFAVSLFDYKSIKEFKDGLVKILNKE